jgi:predicted HAD superfamily Cof-like phosphohydrolase
LIAGELPETDASKDDRVLQVIASVEKNYDKVVQKLVLESSDDDDNNSVLGQSVAVPNNGALDTPARVPKDAPMDLTVSKTPKMKNKKGQESKKKRSTADDGDDLLDEHMANVTKSALFGKNAEATRHHEKMEALEEKKMTKLFEIEQSKLTKSSEQADRQFNHSVKMDERAASQQAASSQIDLQTKNLDLQMKQFELRQKLYAAYTALKEQGMTNKKIKVIHPEMETFFDDDETTGSDAATQKPNKKKKK